ncbi:MAG TPA: YggT family protein [Pseudonocardiaceae bacterium]|nr:YggT family protein [Pseudonocardiaceae bacterium]
MSLIGLVLGYVLTLFILVLIARMILDWARVLSPSSPPWVSRAREFTHAATEPVIEPLRRRMRPVRAGGLAIDLAFTIVFIAAIILRQIAFAL